MLLTYNLTCLYWYVFTIAHDSVGLTAYTSYNLRRKDVDVIDIAYHRAVAVIVGVIWAAIVSRFWWPTEARRALGKALGEYVNWHPSPRRSTLIRTSGSVLTWDGCTPVSSLSTRSLTPTYGRWKTTLTTTMTRSLLPLCHNHETIILQVLSITSWRCEDQTYL